jgi:3-oxoacyl-[acyl-carrier protein] reductase
VTLTGRCAIITGASQGLGAEIAAHFVAEGASVMLCGRDGATLGATAERLAEQARPSQQVLSCVADVSRTADVDHLVEQAMARFGRLDILVNNAGVYGPMGPIEAVDWDDWVAAIQINLMGTVYPCRAVVPIMKAQGYGKIVNLSGGGATNPLPNITAYAASKAAVVRFSESLALELKAHRIDVNAVAPGALATRLLDQVIDASPDAVGAEFHAKMIRTREQGGTPLAKGAELCVYLASAASDGITGRLLSAVWDPWRTLQDRKAELDGSDIYTLRRIVPEDRKKDWT